MLIVPDECIAGSVPPGWLVRRFSGGAMCFPEALADAADSGWFDPDGQGALPVAEGGRQAAWYLDGPYGAAVLRHYRRGGLRARLGRESYLWLGSSRVRSYAETRVLDYLHKKGLRVPQPLAAVYWRSGLFYRAAIIISRIPGARTLSSLLDSADPAAVAKSINRMHAAGVWHADLNAQNILLDEDGQVWLIDFDRARTGRVSTRKQQQSLLRLRRSLIKLAGQRGAEWWDTLDRAIKKVSPDMLSQDTLKQQAAKAAIDYLLPQLQPESILGIGTGSTVDFFIDLLAAHRDEFHGAVSSSDRSTARLKQAGIKVLDLNEVSTLALYFDGADEVDHQLNMIKGGGGALTREKIVASVADRFVCMVDESKLVDSLGRFPLPVEIIPLAREAVAREIRQLGGQPQLRAGYSTDNGNQILDVHGLQYGDPAEFEAVLNNIPGVVCNGLFAISGAHLALIAGQQGIARLELQD